MKMTRLRIPIAVIAVMVFIVFSSLAIAHIDVPLLQTNGDPVTGTTPYSTKMTCGGCHFNCATGAYSTVKSTWCDGTTGKEQYDCTKPGLEVLGDGIGNEDGVCDAGEACESSCPDYESYETTDTSHNQGYPGSNGKIAFATSTTTSPQHGASTGYHSQHGRNEGLTAAQRTIWGAPAFISSPGMFGRYCMPSNRQLVRKEFDPAGGGREIEMSPSNWGKSCGVCHAGGGQMEYDRDMNEYSALSATGDRYTYLIPTASGAGAPVNGGIVDISTLTGNALDRQLMGDNKAEVDCLMCHMSEIRPSAAYYKNTLLCSNSNMTGPADNPNCGNQKVVFMDMNTGTPMMMPDDRFTFANGAFYDSFNRNIAVSYGYFKQAASAGLGAGVDLATGSISGMPSLLAGSKIAAAPNSGNCAQCHARNEQDNIGLPGEAQVFGGMIAGYGNFVRLTPAGQAFDWDKVGSSGACTSNCTNDTRWFEFGCKTGMGKRSQKTGYGSSDRWGNGFCLICDSQNQWSNPISFCALPSVQAACIAKTGIPTLITDGSPMTLVDMTAQGPMPKLIPNKMPDVDVHDKNGVKCADCHYSRSGTIPDRVISGNGATYTYVAGAAMEKMDHNLAKGYSMLEKGGDGFEGTVSCSSCHIAGENNHPNAAALGAPIAGHAGFPAIHFQKIDCRTCHIPAIYAMPGRLMFRDWSAGSYRQTEGSNGNANHFEFAMSLLEGGMTPIRTTPMWITTPEGTKITPVQTNLLPIWAGSVQKDSDNSVMWSPAKPRDVTAAAAVVAAANPAFGIRINGTNDHPGFQGFQLTDPLKIGTKAKIDAMATELGSARSGVVASHAAVRDARLNLYPLFYDTSHGVLEKEWALGAPENGGCVNCHSSSAVNPMTGAPVDPATYSSKSVGFFDGNKELLQNGFMQMAQYDCDNPYIFNMMTTGNPYAGTTPTCIETTPPPYGSGLCDGTAKGTTSTGAQNGTMGLCKEKVGGGLAQQMGMIPDPMMRMDGVEFMQMMAIREGGSSPHAGSPNGCNPMMQIFGLPTGCTGAEYYSRAEIKLYFAKSLEQSFFTPAMAGQSWADPITGAASTVPSTMGRVFGISAQIKKNPGNPAHVNTFDIGATCRNPLDGTTFPCSEAMPGMTNLVNTAVSSKQLLGYDSTRLAKLMKPSTASVPSPTGAFSWTADATTSYKVNFTATGCASGHTCTYDWDFGDSTTGTGATPSHTYAGTTAKTVTLVTTDSTLGQTSAPYSNTVVPVSRNVAPTAAKSINQSGFTVNVVDASTDDAAFPAGAVFVDWGNGTSSTGNAGATISKTYTVAGTYIIKHKVTDAEGLVTWSGNIQVTVPVKYTVSGKVTRLDGTTPVSGASIRLKKGASVVKMTTTNASGDYTLTDVLPDSYTVEAVKSGLTFSSTPAAVVTNVNLTGKDITATR